MRYQWREIGEGQDWIDCSKDRYDYCQKSPQHDTRVLKKTLSVDAEEALNEMNFNQTYYISKKFKGVMGELVDGGYVEVTKNTLGEMLGYRRIKAT